MAVKTSCDPTEFLYVDDVVGYFHGDVPYASGPCADPIHRGQGRRPTRKGLAVAALAIVLLAPRFARAQGAQGAQEAQGAGEAVRLAYHVQGDGCPTAALFREQVVSRSPDVGLTLAELSPQRTVPPRGTENADYVVELFADGRPPPAGEDNQNEAVGRAYAYQHGIPSLLKELRGATCPEVASALALVLSLAIERRRDTPSGWESEPPVTPPEDRAGLRSGPTPPASARSRWTPAVGIATSWGTGYLAKPLFGGALFLEIDRPWIPPFRFQVRLSASHQRGRKREAWGSAEVRLTGGVIDLCPVRFLVVPYTGDGRGAELAACAGVEMGQLAVSGDVVDGQSGEDGAFYGDVRASLRPRLALSQHFWADLEVGGRASWQRYALQIRGVDNSVYESHLGVFASAGVAYMFR